MTNFKSISNITNFKYYQLFGICLFAYLLICLFAPAGEANAQSSRSFTISPPSIHLTLNPGQKTERTLKITNNSNEDIEFSASVQDFIVTNKAGTPELLPVGVKPDNKFAASFWTAVLPDAIVVKAGKTATTNLYLNVPADARPGGRYVAVTFRPTVVGTPEGSGAAINPVVGSLIYLTVVGKTTENARIVQFLAPSLSEFGPININTEIKNLGDLHISPKGVIEIKNLFGKKVFSTALANLNIFPGTARIYTNTWEEKLLFGKFQANFSGYYGQANNLPLIAMTTFWVIPYKLIAIAALATAIAIVAFIYFRKKQETEEAKKQ